MHAYLVDLAEAVAKAQSISFQTEHHPLKLGQNVRLELIGFYEDPDPESTTDVRLYVSKHRLDEFLDKGPERCLQERLNAVAAKPHKYRPQTLTSAANDGIRASTHGRANKPPRDKSQAPVTARSTGADDQVRHAESFYDLAAGFSRPNPNKRKFMWIHLPFNNPYWVKSIFNKLAEGQHQTYSKLLRNENWVSRHVRGRHAQAHSSYVRPGCDYISSETHSPRPSSPSISGRSSPAGTAPSHLYLYLPYLHFDTYKNVIKRRKTIRRRLGLGRARPVPEDIALEESLEMRVTWEFIGHDPPLNTRRTLDQYGYPSLRDTYARDDDQMLYKLTKERVAFSKTRKHHPIGEAPDSRDFACEPAGHVRQPDD
ncbi:ankyrin repeat protein [Apiospora kogelbergensis]|uniref:ankyrin repeat protein n=1 Tax=Apiospora kogelbergensis TaxID=1337665 RepID=UPI00312FE81B